MKIKDLLRRVDWSSFARKGNRFMLRDEADRCPIHHALGTDATLFALSAVTVGLTHGMDRRDIRIVMTAADLELRSIVPPPALTLTPKAHRIRRHAFRLRRWMLAQIEEAAK